MAWQLIQQAVTKVSQPAPVVHELFINSTQTYLEIVHALLDKYDGDATTAANVNNTLANNYNSDHMKDDNLMDIDDATSNTNMNFHSSGENIETLEAQMQHFTQQIDALQPSLRYYLQFLEPCYQLYVNIQKRKTPVPFLLDEIEFLMKRILQSLVPLSQRYEESTETANMLHKKIVSIRYNHNNLISVSQNDGDTKTIITSNTIVSSENTTGASAIPSISQHEETTAALATDKSAIQFDNSSGLLSLEIPSVNSDVDNNNNNGSAPVSGTKLVASTLLSASSNSIDTFTPRTPHNEEHNNNKLTFPTFPKASYEEHWDSKELLIFVGSMFAPAKSTLSTGPTTASGTATITGNKRSRAQQASSGALPNGSNTNETTMNDSGNASNNSNGPPSKQQRTKQNQSIQSASTSNSNSNSSNQNYMDQSYGQYDADNRGHTVETMDEEVML